MDNIKAKKVMIVVLTVLVSLLVVCVIYMSITKKPIQEIFKEKEIISEEQENPLATMQMLAEQEYSILLSEKEDQEDIITAELIKSCLEAKGINCSEYNIVLSDDGKITISKKEPTTGLEQIVDDQNQEQQENVKISKVKVNAIINELNRNSSVKVYWNEAKNATNYEIYRVVQI